MNLFGKTDVGRKRENNQDVFYLYQFSSKAGFAIVCDGMGGQSGGHIASDMTCTVVSQRLMDGSQRILSGDGIRELMVEAISEANIEVYKRSNTEPGCKGMGTTIVLAVILGEQVHLAHIGDSRAYLFSGGRLHQLTRDHSLVQELRDQGKISDEEMKHHPNKNMITRAVGVNLMVDIDYLELSLEPGSKLLLCSDGLTNMVPDEEIAAVLRYQSGETVCGRLIALANGAGGADNITVAVAE
ncbi:MAG: Stp1/IreP family PP2C-type Ser/Thr phosphatase [Oscillospiraceae bacterium]|nr:Stp1/IreP family PP2C-type Ser/Thr phosphatase [Oscillospiraceae bacterium]